MGNYQQPIMSDFSPPEQAKIEKAAELAKQLYDLLPDQLCGMRCNSRCWANRIVVISSEGTPATLCFAAFALRNALKLLMASKI